VGSRGSIWGPAQQKSATGDGPALSQPREISSAPGRSRTYDLSLRKRLLYPTELRERVRRKLLWLWLTFKCRGQSAVAVSAVVEQRGDALSIELCAAAQEAELDEK